MLKRKTLFNQRGSFVHQEFHGTKSLIGCLSLFVLVLKIGRNVKKKHPVCVFYISKFVIDLFKTCYLICCYLVWALDLFCSRILENKGTIILQRNWFTNKFDRKLKSCALKLWTSFSVGYSVAMSGDNDDDDDWVWWKCFSSVLLHQPLCQSITCNWLI